MKTTVYMKTADIHVPSLLSNLFSLMSIFKKIKKYITNELLFSSHVLTKSNYFEIDFPETFHSRFLPNDTVNLVQVFIFFKKRRRYTWRCFYLLRFLNNDSYFTLEYYEKYVDNIFKVKFKPSKIGIPQNNWVKLCVFHRKINSN